MEGVKSLNCSSNEEVSSATFMNYNSTGIDSVTCNFICDICDEYDVDYVAIQEHFKNTSTINSYFRKKFDSFSPYVIPAFRAPGQDTGRCKAGMAQLSSKNLDVNNIYCA